VVKIRDKEIRTALVTSPTGTPIRKVSCPSTRRRRGAAVADAGQRARQLPHTAGTSPSNAKAKTDPHVRWEGDAFRTNTRFKLLSEGMAAKRLSTAVFGHAGNGNDPHRASGHLRKAAIGACSIATWTT
jgi:methylmalonyl-CoA mutase